MKLVTAAEMRALEDAVFASGTSQAELMERAGRAVAEAVRDYLGSVRAARIIVLVGPGNNGGDGLIAARHLASFDSDVSVFLLTPRPADDANLAALAHLEVELVDLTNGTPLSALEDALARADVVVDAVLGTGRQRPLEGLVAAAFERLKERRMPLIAIDLPTGVDPDSGAVDPHAAGADLTLTLGLAKVGLYALPGSEHAGEITVLDIGLGAAGEAIATELLTEHWAQDALPDRPSESNKGTFGRVLVVAGSMSFTGAAALSAIGALRAGAGLVTIACTPSVRSAVVALLPEVTYLVLPETPEGGIDAPAGDLIARAAPDYDALLIGPGLGLGAGTQAMVRGVLTAPALAGIPTVIDADALNALSRQASWWSEVKARAVLTPHPGELARLAHLSIAEVQVDRLTVARRCAAEWNQTIVLKGAHTVVVRPDGQALVSQYATALLATAGTGDVLAGAIGGLVAQGVEPDVAAGLGVYLHGAAAELHRDDYGVSGLLASELGSGIARSAARLRRTKGKAPRGGA